MKLYKLVVKDANGKVVQIHEIQGNGAYMAQMIDEETDKGHRVTVTKIGG